MPKRNPKNISFGVFAASSSVNFLGKDEVRKHFFRTSSEREFSEKKLTEEDVSENMLHIHNAGKTYGKYLPYKTSTAPMLDRESCNYTQAFTQKPSISLQYQCNSAMADSFRPTRVKCSSASGSAAGWKSSSSQTFAGQTPSEMARAKPPMCTAASSSGLEAIVGGKGKMLVTRSHLQTTHAADFPRHLAATSQAHEAKGNIDIQGYHGGDFSRSSYHGDFNGRNQNRQQAVGSAFRLQLQRSSSSPGQL